MKHTLLAALFITAITCHTNYPPATLGRDSSAVSNDFFANETLSGKWLLQPVLASDTASGKIPTINFDLTKHTFTGNTGCNTMSGSFIIKADSLRFNEQMISTQMACPGYNEKAFFDNLVKTNRYQIKEGVLQLMYNATVLSNWVRHADTTKTKQI
jgi:heat shock protein HslJ